MCCHDATQAYCGSLNHTCQCPNQTVAGCTAMAGAGYWRDEVARDGSLATSVDKARYSWLLNCCPDSVILNGDIIMRGCSSSCKSPMPPFMPFPNGTALPIAYACMGYSESAKVKMGACDANDLLLWTTVVGSYSMCRRRGADALDRQACAGATLQVSMSMAQIRLGANASSVKKTYKLGAFASDSTSCSAGMAPGWRWRGTAASEVDGTCDMMALNGRQMEFEQPFEWRNMSGNLLGKGWSMTQLRFNSNITGADLMTSAQLGSRCFYSAGATGSAGIHSCPNNKIGADGVKFVLELDQSSQGYSYPHGASDFWTECEADAGAAAGAECAQCFVADFALLGAASGATITSSKSDRKIEVQEASGDKYVYSFEDIVNVVAGSDFTGNGFGYDFKKGSVVLADGSSKLNKKVYVCLPKASYDPSRPSSTPCPNNPNKTCAVSFLYDPEMSIKAAPSVASTTSSNPVATSNARTTTAFVSTSSTATQLVGVNVSGSSPQHLNGLLVALALLWMKCFGAQ